MESQLRGMKYKTTSLTRGFTILEMMVVVTIIGILATAGTVSYSQFQASARDSKRVADLEQMALALVLDREDRGSYPNSDEFENALTRQMGSVPQDPRSGQAGFGYQFARVTCTSDLDVIVVWASQMERPGNTSRTQIQHCDLIDDNDLGDTNSFVQVVEFVRN